MSEWLSEYEIKAIGTKHGKRDGKHDAGNVGRLEATIGKISAILTNHGRPHVLNPDVRIREEAYLVAYVLEWGKD